MEGVRSTPGVIPELILSQAGWCLWQFYKKGCSEKRGLRRGVYLWELYKRDVVKRGVLQKGCYEENFCEKKNI